jgi:FkbM family methyltransferase
VLHRLTNKPHYLWRPRQMVRRAVRARRPAAGPTLMLPLPWGASLECFSGDAIASSIARSGVYDLLMTEALFRLADPGETAVDAGGNVGYASSALAAAVGAAGRVLAVEPHPAVHALLARNAGRWKREAPALAPIELCPLALSEERGQGALATGATFEANRGTATLAPEFRPFAAAQVAVPLVTLDELAARRPIGVLKLDVEGHELEVLKGAPEQLGAGLVRDVLVEARRGRANPVTELLGEHGYAIFETRSTLTGPRIGAARPDSAVDYLEPPTLRATLDPERLLRRFGPRGWRSLRRPRKRPGVPVVQ